MEMENAKLERGEEVATIAEMLMPEAARHDGSSRCRARHRAPMAHHPSRLAGGRGRSQHCAPPTTLLCPDSDTRSSPSEHTAARSHATPTGLDQECGRARGMH